MKRRFLLLIIIFFSSLPGQMLNATVKDNLDKLGVSFQYQSAHLTVFIHKATILSALPQLIRAGVVPSSLQQRTVAQQSALASELGLALTVVIMDLLYEKHDDLNILQVETFLTLPEGQTMPCQHFKFDHAQFKNLDLNQITVTDFLHEAKGLVTDSSCR